jgi:hypothetical protein
MPASKAFTPVRDEFEAMNGLLAEKRSAQLATLFSPSLVLPR